MSNQDDLTGMYYITPEDEWLLALDAMPAVDLSIADSPVLPHASSGPVETMRTVGGKYLLRYGQVQLLNGTYSREVAAEVVTEDELRSMRARYLIRLKYYQLYFPGPALTYYERDQLLHDYFGGSLYQLPENLLREARKGWRLHLEAVRHAPPPDKHTVEGTLREMSRSLTQGREG